MELILFRRSTLILKLYGRNIVGLSDGQANCVIVVGGKRIADTILEV
jgi:hypothetical protein